ncbi:MAG: hypothetical protein ACHBN1_15540 [Heteroscytonema crispum UTEX LB 1556]
MRYKSWFLIFTSLLTTGMIALAVNPVEEMDLYNFQKTTNETTLIAASKIPNLGIPRRRERGGTRLTQSSEVGFYS